MPSVKCNSCGHVFGIGSFPNPNAYRAVSEKQYDDLGRIETVDVLDRLLFSGTRIYVCRNCSDLIVYWDNKDEPESYRKIP